ncbi:sugar transferase [Paenibacillus pini]|uniref:Undecaprenyl-phosphate galactosephosphotransferase n=1 Tax=Paenibacillus pini JCM 16418 TaxID=1236976 RepID=W7YI01_9BACL|nr:sugar transferase [Paenibacillus pini]GAF08072.1 undecaprenyl-phosphate galactosephosphotransferase [Paenibacillus pini JCM 16418]
MSMKPLEKTMEVGQFSSEVFPVYQNKGRTRFEWIKRIQDIVLSLLGILILSPVFIIIALFIKAEDPRGPIFFAQVRVGKNGIPFRMFKFRSMAQNAEERLAELIHQNEIHGAMFKMKNDPRVTRIGRIIRKTSMDELPQLLNVLRGEMSLVGPRPPLPREVNDYTPYDMQRLMVIPGCTGLWQVSGRNHVGFHEMVELDLKYIREQSFTNDLRILLRTVKVVLGSNDAY